MQPGQMHDRTRNVGSRLDPLTRQGKRANGSVRTTLPNKAPADIGSPIDDAPEGATVPPAQDQGLVERLAAMRAQAPAGGAQAGVAGNTTPPPPAGVPIAQPQLLSHDMIDRYVEEMRTKLLYLNGGV